LSRAPRRRNGDIVSPRAGRARGFSGEAGWQRRAAAGRGGRFAVSQAKRLV